MVVLALSALTLITLDMRDFGPLERLKDGVSGVLSPVRDAAGTVFGPVGEAWSAAFGGDDLESENAELRARLEELEGESIRNADKARLYDELAAELRVDFLDRQERVVAKVIAGGAGNFDTELLEIDKGSRDGVRQGQPVVSAGGLVGQVTEVRRSRSLIRLVTDPRFAVGIRLIVNDEIALLTGGGAGQPLRVDGGIGLDTPIRPGMSVTTSGIDRSRFPGGIPVGTVIEGRVNEGALEQELLVRPSADLTKLEFVTVILYDPDADDGDDPDGEVPSTSGAEGAGTGAGEAEVGG